VVHSFFTLATYTRQPIFNNNHARFLLRKTWLETTRNRPFHLEATCLLSDHLHFIIRLAENDIDYSTHIVSIKGRFTKTFLEENKTNGFGAGRRDKGERTVWQHHFWEHLIKDEMDFENHVDYIYYNPVKNGLVTRVQDWPFSSFHRYVREGIYPKDWGSVNKDFECDSFGE